MTTTKGGGFKDYNKLLENTPLSIAAKELGNSLGLDINARVFGVKDGSTLAVTELVSTLKSATTNEWDIDNATTIEFIVGDNDTLTSIAVPLINNPNTMTCFVEFEGNTKTYVLDFIFDEENETLSYYLNTDITPVELKGFLNWTDCMGGVMDSHIGVFIAVGGVGASLGCVPCGGVAAVLTAVSALGCLG